MNKTDILAKKIEQGVQVKDHIPEFGNNKNEFTVVAKCRFRMLHDR